MSRAIALVKFKKTDNIYWGCYDGTSDCMYNNLIPYNELDFKQYDFDMFKSSNFKPINRKNITDIDNIEIYSDYGGGFYWDGKGSELNKCITYGFYPTCESIDNYYKGFYDEFHDGEPDWVTVIFDRLLKRW